MVSCIDLMNNEESINQEILSGREESVGRWSKRIMKKKKKKKKAFGMSQPSFKKQSCFFQLICLNC